MTSVQDQQDKLSLYKEAETVRAASSSNPPPEDEMLDTTKEQPLTYPEKLEIFEGFLLSLPQAECPVVHHFGPGIYIREVHIPAGAFALGHAQRYEQLNIMLKGKVVISNEEGGLRVLKAPLIFTGPPGRKFGYVIEDTIWQNVYSTKETDIEKLEAFYLDKSPSWKKKERGMVLENSSWKGDRKDFKEFLKESGLSAGEVRRQSENSKDQINLPPNQFPKVVIRNSPIEGKGGFASFPIKRGEIIGPALYAGKRTILGRYINHAKVPNAHFKQVGDLIFLIANRDIKGSVGGGPGEEITIDYRESPRTKNLRSLEECQE